ncbi:MAG: YidC/Oxa1 family membrane protein insertase [Thermomicrobiales bacterium]
MFDLITGPWGKYVDFIEWCLHRLTDFTGSGGLAIIVFTIILKTILLPLTVKSIKSTAAMQELQPKIKELQKKYAKDRPRLTEETMRLYQEYQINPAAGCLPMLIQIPIFFGLYFAVRDLSRTAGDFLWLSNLNEADPYKILPIMAGIFQFVQTKMMRPANAPKVTDPQQAMMNTMMNFMPIMVIVFGWTFASGAVLYWATQSVYSVAQQWLITGWGSLKNWFPALEKAEMPEHRRLGHRKQPLERTEIVGEVQQKGLMGYMQRQAKEAERRRADAAEARGESATSGASRSTGESGKRAKQARAQANQRNVSGASEGEIEDDSTDAGSDTTSKTRVMSGPGARNQRRTRGSK